MQSCRQAVIETGSWLWHGLVYRFVNRVGSSIDGKIVSVARVTGDDRFASEVDVNFGSNFALKRLFNVAGGLDSNAVPTPTQRIGPEVVVGIDTTIWSKDRVKSSCDDWLQRPIKGLCRALLPGDSPKLMSAAQIDSKIGDRVGSGSGHRMR